MAPLSEQVLDHEGGYAGLAFDDDKTESVASDVEPDAGPAKPAWRPRMPVTMLATILLGALVLALWRGGDLSRIEPSAAEVKQAMSPAAVPGAPVAPAAPPAALPAAPPAAPAEPFSCAKYGCLDVRTTNACQCSAHCLQDGGCCPDFKAVCQNPGRHAAALGPWSKCPPGAVPPPPGIERYVPKGQPLQVKVMSFNPEWWHLIEQLGGGGNSAGKLIVTASTPVPYDFIGFQEFYDPWFGLTRPGFDASAVLREYMWVRGEVGGPVGTIIGFRNATWSLISRGQRYVAEDKQGPMYYGKRIALWARFAHRATGKTVFFMNHHGPLPVDTGGICGGQRTAFNLLQLIAQHAQSGDAVVFVGDFNAATASPTIGTLSSRLTPSFTGIDHIFTNLGPQAVKWQAALGKGGSDHDAIGILLELAGSGVAAGVAVQAA